MIHLKPYGSCSHMSFSSTFWSSQPVEVAWHWHLNSTLIPPKLFLWFVSIVSIVSWTCTFCCSTQWFFAPQGGFKHPLCFQVAHQASREICTLLGLRCLSSKSNLPSRALEVPRLQWGPPQPDKSTPPKAFQQPSERGGNTGSRPKQTLLEKSSRKVSNPFSRFGGATPKAIEVCTREVSHKTMPVTEAAKSTTWEETKAKHY